MLAYLFSRYPVVSQTFCDSEMLALEKLGVPLAIGSLNPPPDSFRHPRLAGREAPVFYPPPSKALASIRKQAEADGSWAPLAELVAEHDAKYGEAFKAATRARNALYFGRVFKEIGVTHVHVHFANRATHTALFLKRMGIPFSFTAHAQDFMVDLGSDDLLREMAREATFVAGVSDFSSGLLKEKCPDSADKIVRVYNGLDPDSFTKADAGRAGDALKVVTVGRLIEFKGFTHLIAACADLNARGIKNQLTIVGDGPLEDELKAQADGSVTFAGVQSGEEIKALLADSDVFALGSIVDSKGASDILPTVIAEAMAARLPVVSTRLVGIPEMVEHGETGLLCEPGDEAEMAAALEKLAADPALRARYGAAGEELCRERFALVVTAKQLLGLFPDDAKTAPTYPKVAYLAPAWGDRDVRSCDPELAAAAAHPDVLPVVQRLHEDFRSHSLAPPEGLSFVPDDVVLEAAQRAEGRGREPLVLYLAEFLGRLGVTHVHAARAGLAATAGEVAALIGAKATCCIEDGAAETGGEVEALTGLDLSVRQTRRKLGPFRFRLKPKPISSDAAEVFVRELAEVPRLLD